ncbi:cytochrome b-c1 complex subunit 6-1 [Citrus sinensis]|nr:cytochrome b-c1 complex subunit 6-1 [Citrus sinensis]
MKAYMKRKLKLNDRAGIRQNKNFHSLVIEVEGDKNLSFLEKGTRKHLNKERCLRLGKDAEKSKSDYVTGMNIQFAYNHGVQILGTQESTIVQVIQPSLLTFTCPPFAMADEELVDQKKYFEEACKPKCVKPLLEYQACVKRIQGDESGHKHCTGQYFDYWSCIDKCFNFFRFIYLTR